MKMTKKQLEELVDKTGALIGSKNKSPKIGGSFIGSYDTTDDHVEKTTQDRSYETPYRRYFGEDDLSNHPLFDISKKAKSYSQFIEMSKKHKPKMDNDELEDAASLFGFRKDKKRIVKEKEMTEGMLRFSDGIEIDTSGKLRPLELYDGWYVVGEGNLIPVKSEGEAKILINKMSGKNPPVDCAKCGGVGCDLCMNKEKFNENYEVSLDDVRYFRKLMSDKDIVKKAIEKFGLDKYKKLILATAKHHWELGDGEKSKFPKKDYEILIDELLKDIGIIEESAKSLLEKIVKVKTKEDVLPKMAKSNNHIDKAISHLKNSIDSIEKYKNNSKVSDIYKSLEKTIESLEKIVDKIEDKTELMDSINESSYEKLNPENKEKYDRLFGIKNSNEDFNRGYQNGYNDGYLDGKTNSPFNDKYDWNKYGSKK